MKVIRLSTSVPYRNEFIVHPDLEGLIWIGDGEKQNYKLEYKEISTDFISFKISFGPSEPSAIYTNLPISEPVDFNDVEKLGYYPSYRGMSPNQRWKYLMFLREPYSNQYEIGYVFVLYYGLERHLLFGDYQRAFEVIRKLRIAHNHGSFHGYSMNALILSSVLRNEKERIRDLLVDIKKHNFSINPSYYMLIKSIIRERIEPYEIIQFHKNFKLKNTYYIRKMPKLYFNELVSLYNLEDEERLYPHNFIKKDTPRNLHLVFANISFETRSVQVPDLFEIEEFISFGNSLLHRTNLKLKETMANNRKSKLE